MGHFASLLEKNFYTAMRWCFKHQPFVLVAIILAVIMPIGTLNIVEYTSMKKYEETSTQDVQQQLQYILNRLVSQIQADLLTHISYFHRVDTDHALFLKGDKKINQALVDDLQGMIIELRQKYKKSKDFKIMTFMAASTPQTPLEIIFPQVVQDPIFKAASLRARAYFLKLSPLEQDVAYLFFYDQQSELLILLHPVVPEEFVNYERIDPPRPIRVLMGLSLPKSIFNDEFFDCYLVTCSKPTRYATTTPVETFIATANYHFRVLDDRGTVLFTNTDSWSQLERNDDYVGADLKLTAEQKFLTGWQFSVLTKATFRQITDWSIAQMLWASTGVVVILCLLLVLILRAGLIAMRVSDMKADIVAGVSHDLKTPLAGILASAQLLASGRVSGNDETREFAGYIVTEAQRLRGMVDKVLTLAKLESRQLEMHQVPINITELVDQAIQSVGCAFPGAVLLKGGIPQGEVYGDFQALLTVLVNLMENAVRYSNDPPWVKVQAFWSQSGDKRTLHLQVEDRGIGIPPGEQPFIFQKFYRVRNGLVTDTEGTGLGLAIASQIVKAHNGHIQVESEVGLGSKFTVRIPT